jgi:molybdopterin-guanine dinucleotide biosynthesis protein A
MSSHPATLGLVLAGGLARRMGGGDKPLLEINGETILARALARFRPQCAGLVINANGDPVRFTAFGYPVVADSVPDFAGPLAGILAGLDWVAKNAPEIEWIATVPGDCPFLPRDLVAKLHAARQASNAPLACARTGGRMHPVAGIFPVALREDLRAALVTEKLHKVGVWVGRHNAATAEWPDQPVDPFFNVNTPEDRAAAETLARQYPGV